MLIENTNIAAGEVVALKPLDGPDIIGRVALDYKGTDEIALRKPVNAHVVQSPEGGLGLAFSPYSLCSKDDHIFRFSLDRLAVAPFLARDEVKKTYNEQTTSLKLL